MILHMPEKFKEYNFDSFHLFIDFRTAFDSILRSNLYHAKNKLKFLKF